MTSAGLANVFDAAQLSWTTSIALDASPDPVHDLSLATLQIGRVDFDNFGYRLATLSLLERECIRIVMIRQGISDWSRQHSAA